MHVRYVCIYLGVTSILHTCTQVNPWVWNLQRQPVRLVISCKPTSPRSCSRLLHQPPTDRSQHPAHAAHCSLLVHPPPPSSPAETLSFSDASDTFKIVNKRLWVGLLLALLTSAFAYSTAVWCRVDHLRGVSLLTEQAHTLSPSSSLLFFPLPPDPTRYQTRPWTWTCGLLACATLFGSHRHLACLVRLVPGASCLATNHPSPLAWDPRLLPTTDHRPTTHNPSCPLCLSSLACLDRSFTHARQSLVDKILGREIGAVFIVFIKQGLRHELRCLKKIKSTPTPSTLRPRPRRRH